MASHDRKTVNLTPDVHKTLKVRAAMEGVTASSLAEKLILENEKRQEDESGSSVVKRD